MISVAITSRAQQNLIAKQLKLPFVPEKDPFYYWLAYQEGPYVVVVPALTREEVIDAAAQRDTHSKLSDSECAALRSLRNGLVFRQSDLLSPITTSHDGSSSLVLPLRTSIPLQIPLYLNAVPSATPVQTTIELIPHLDGTTIYIWCDSSTQTIHFSTAKRVDARRTKFGQTQCYISEVWDNLGGPPLTTFFPDDVRAIPKLCQIAYVFRIVNPAQQILSRLNVGSGYILFQGIVDVVTNRLETNFDRIRTDPRVQWRRMTVHPTAPIATTEEEDIVSSGMYEFASEMATYDSYRVYDPFPAPSLPENRPVTIFDEPRFVSLVEADAYLHAGPMAVVSGFLNHDYAPLEPNDDGNGGRHGMEENGEPVVLIVTHPETQDQLLYTIYPQSYVSRLQFLTSGGNVCTTSTTIPNSGTIKKLMEAVLENTIPSAFLITDEMIQTFNDHMRIAKTYPMGYYGSSKVNNDSDDDSSRRSRWYYAVVQAACSFARGDLQHEAFQCVRNWLVKHQKLQHPST